ncbi:hypothetical protein SAMN00120144_2034 [Hymenobacter roseosalivarius DSM 11622]|uniref:GIY-YIG domain-containing protein n=1 Tax=Hymenobacter roseosalivarius DSM 11622 TaxID=645990 RepID=A0A1W1VNR9_9BACT|nr:hypothetical protein [Hymenobacter roseosalivarius]SMB94594.1 hypothetical protein SAMN00120144_2034 [Hymenobacter roseosalivarius DSM 11622]
MRNVVLEMHQLLSERERFYFPFKKNIDRIPNNGIYFLFEKGETYKEFDRVVRVGTHNGPNRLSTRLNQHFLIPKKNGSIFRKNIGRCFLNKEQNPYLKYWEIDTTSRLSRKVNENFIDNIFEKQLEERISHYIQNNFSFCVLQINNKDERLFWESRMISTLAKAKDIEASQEWLGRHSTKEKIRVSGLWQVNELYKDCLTETEFDQIKYSF